MARSDWSSKAARVRALEAVIADDSAGSYTRMEAVKELRRLTTRSRRSTAVKPSGDLDDVMASLAEWLRVVALPSLGLEPDAVSVDDVFDEPPLTFKPVEHWTWPDGSPLIDDVDGRIWRCTTTWQLFWIGHELGGVAWGRLSLPSFESRVFPGWATGPDPFPLREPR